jgi:hypothetical protein
MRLTFVKKDPRSSLGNSPAVYTTDDGTLIIQGWVLTDETSRAEMKIPAGEDAVEIPLRMVPFIVAALLKVYEQVAGEDTINRLKEDRDQGASGISTAGAVAGLATIDAAA